MELNQTTLRDLLSAALGMDEQYILPLQSNWYNPQDMMSTPDKPLTWCAYRIESNTPIDLPYYEEADSVNQETPTSNWSTQHKVATIHLQFVGDIAEDLANSVGHWFRNSSLRQQLDLIGGQLFGDSGAVTATDFIQEGANTVLSYNVRIRIAWASSVETAQPAMPDMVFQGGIT